MDMQFRLASYFNPHLPPDGRRVDAVLTVTASGGEGAATVGSRAVALVLDLSGSMFQRGKIEAAKHAARKWVALLPEDVDFAVVGFGSEARVVCPMRRATPEARQVADRAIQNLSEMGGTEMSKGLALTRKEFAKTTADVRYAMFLTDGRNEGEIPRLLDEEIARCKGAFQCDCRGVGTDWMPSELRKVSNALLGTADAVSEPAGLDADFRASLGTALSKGQGDVRLELWQPATSRLVSLHQMQPENVDLTSLGAKVTERVTSFPLGAWGADTRDYHAVFEVGLGTVGDEMLVCRPAVTWAGQKAQAQPVVATWSDDPDATARIAPEVAHYTGQAELAESIREGMEAKGRGDVERATRLLGRAAKIAEESGNEEVTRRLSKVVDVVDASQGTVRLRRGASKGEELELEMGGTRTVRRAPKAAE